jgi:PAS domain S-box-containing protein
MEDGRLLEHPYLKSQPAGFEQQWNARAKEVIRRSNQLLKDQDWAHFEYEWPIRDTGKLGTKRAYVHLIEPWGWVLGSGRSAEVIRAHVRRLTAKIVWVLGGIVVVAAGLLILVICHGLRTEKSRSKAEASLKTSEEKYRLLADCTSDGIALVMDDRIAYANPALHEMLGYEQGSLEGREASNVLRNGEGQSLLAQCRLEAQKGEKVSWPMETSLMRSDGTQTDVMVSPARAEFHDQEASILAIADITQRLRSEKERDDLRLQYLQSQKMEAIGRLAGGIAHDFRNQLTVINGYTSLLLRKVSDRSAARRPLEQILKSTALSGKLANQLLAFSRKQPLKPVPVAVNESVRDMFESLSSIIGEDIQLRIDLDEECGKVMVDDGQIEQAMMNLAVNARDAMPQGGTLLIQTRRVHVNDGGETVDAGRSGSSPAIRLSVMDTGVGMDEATRRQVFEPFYTTKAEDKGTGLGLAMVYSFVTQAGGRVDLETAPGQGTTFHLILPECSEADAPCRNESGRLALRQDLRGTLLVVEDDDQVRSMLVGILRGYGHTVLEACDASQAIPLGEHYEQQIDVLVTDIVMPGMDGIQMAQRLQRCRSNMGLLFISGYTSRTEELRSLTQRGAGFLLKPFSPDSLLQAIEEQLLRRGKGTWQSDLEDQRDARHTDIRNTDSKN